MKLEEYPTTQVALLDIALHSKDPDEARRALAEICAYYSETIHAEMRARFREPAEAEDAAQDFLCRWLQKESPFGIYQRGDIPFRRWLRTCINNYCRGRAKRPTEPLEPIGPEPVSPPEPTTLDLGIARQVAQVAFEQLGKDWRGGPCPRREAFPEVAAIVFLGDETQHATLAQKHHVPVSTVRGWVLSLRKDFGGHFREAVKRHCPAEQLGDEFRFLVELVLCHADTKTFFATLLGLDR